MRWLRRAWAWLKEKTMRVVVFFTGATIAFAAVAGSVPIEQPVYAVRTGDAAETNFVFSAEEDIKGLKKAEVIGTACYREYRDPDRTEKTQRTRIDCADHYKARDVKGHKIPEKIGYRSIEYSTWLFDTPSGDLEEGYYADSDKKQKSTVGREVLDAVIPTAEAAVAYDTSVNSGISSADTITFNITVPVGGMLTVGTAVQDLTAADQKTNFCSYNTAEMFLVGLSDASTSFTLTDFELHNPTTGSALAVFCQFNDTSAGPPANSGVIASTFTGTDTSYAADVFIEADGTSAQAAITITPLREGSMIATWNITDETDASDILASGTGHTDRSEVDYSGENFNMGTVDPISPIAARTPAFDWTGSEAWEMNGFTIAPPCVAGTKCRDYITVTGTTTWTAPTTETIQVACWGAGSGGGAVANNGGGGGGGGAYASSSVSVTASVGYSVFIGTGGAQEVAGTRSHFFDGSTYTPIACSGTAAADSTAGAGGTTACSVGSLAENAGGNGAAGDTTTSNDGGGGGGGAGGPTGAGVAGTAPTISIGGPGGAGDNGNGGTGGSEGGSSSAGAQGAGSKRGGGGGGGADNGTGGGIGGTAAGGGGGETTGGEGGDGMCEISYTAAAAPPPPPPGPPPLYRDSIWDDL